MSELSPQFQKRLGMIQQFTTLLWATMNISLVIFGIVLTYVPSKAASADTHLVNMLGIVFPILCLTQSGIAFVVYNYLLSEKRILAQLAKFTSSHDSSNNIPIDEDIPAREHCLLSIVTTFQQSTLVCMVFHESIAIMGFVVAFLAKSPTTYIPYALVTLSLNIRIFPRIEQFCRRVFELQRASGLKK